VNVADFTSTLSQLAKEFRTLACYDVLLSSGPVLSVEIVSRLLSWVQFIIDERIDPNFNNLEDTIELIETTDPVRTSLCFSAPFS
jgi:hypothetical protein